MSDVKWIKLSVDIFDNSKIKHIRRLPDGNNILLIWVMLLTMAGKSNSDGYILLTKDIPYTIEMLSDELGFSIATVNLALNMFSQLGMIELDNGAIFITGWSDHQNFEKLDKIKEQNRLRQAKFRENKRKAKALLESNVTLTSPVTLNNATDIDIELDKDIDKDIELDKDIDNTSNKDNQWMSKNFTSEKSEVEKEDIEKVMTAWNNLNLTQLRNIKGNREKALHARIKEYSIEDVLKAIDSINNSEFLKGHNNNGWKITFDWLLKPNNFVKVLEGNYVDKDKKVDKPKRVLNTELDFNYKSDSEFDQF